MNYTLDPNGIYYAYLRKSREDRDAEDRGEGDTLLRHRNLLKELSNRLSIPISKFYEEVVSGESIAARPKMQQLLKELEAGHCTGIFVVEIERLARGDAIDQGIIARAFKQHNTLIITPLKIYNPADEYDEEYFEFNLFNSRREYRTINRRMQRGRIVSAKEGKIVDSTAPYGYRKKKLLGEKGYTLEIVPEEAVAVTHIYEWYAAGIGMSTIAARLDALGISPRVKEHWSRATIHDILSNSKYIGMIRRGWQKEEKNYLENGSVKKTRTRSENYLYVKGLHPAIICEELWSQVQQLLKMNQKATIPNGKKLKNPLSGLVYCKKCGHLMTRLGSNSKTPYAFLKCPNRYCNNISSALSVVEQEILNHLQSQVNRYQIEYASQPPTKEEQNLTLLQAIEKQLEAELSTLQHQLEKTYTFLEQDIYTPEVFKERRAALISQINTTETKLEEAHTDYTQAVHQHNSKTNFIPKVQKILDIYQTISSAAQRNRLLKQVITKVDYLKTAPNHRGQAQFATFQLDVFPRL